MATKLRNSIHEVLGPQMVRGFLIIILLFAGIAKSMDADEFQATLSRSGLLLPGTETLTRLIIVLAEFLVAVSLLFGRALHIALLVAAGLSSLFFGYSVWRWWQDIYAPCGCFGILFRLDPIASGLLSASMCAGSLWVASRPKRNLFFVDKVSRSINEASNRNTG